MNIYEKLYKKCGWAPFGWTAEELPTPEWNAFCGPDTKYNDALRRCEGKLKCGPGTHEVDGVCQIKFGGEVVVTQNICDQSQTFHDTVNNGGSALVTLTTLENDITQTGMVPSSIKLGWNGIQTNC